jgi:exonuclease SbcC
MWEEYKNKTAEKRKALEREVDEIDGRIREVDAELAEEDLRKARLAELESSLKQLTTARTAQESILENIKRNAALVDEQRKMTAMLFDSLERARLARAGLEDRLAAKQADRDSYADLVHRAKEIESAYKAWQKSRKELEEWDNIASQFREYEKDRAPLLEQIAVEKARLEQELEGLQEQAKSVEDQLLVISNLGEQIDLAKQSLAESEKRLKERENIMALVQSARERQAELKAENEALKADMNELKERIDSLKAAEEQAALMRTGTIPEHRMATSCKLENEGKQEGDRFRANQAESAELVKQITDYEIQVSAAVPGNVASNMPAKYPS